MKLKQVLLSVHFEDEKNNRHEVTFVKSNGKLIGNVYFNGKHLQQSQYTHAKNGNRTKAIQLIKEAHKK